MRRILSLFLVLLLQFILSAETRAQTPAPSCPAIKILSSERYSLRLLPCFIYEVTLQANVTNVAASDKPAFKWTASAGKVISGQGTSTVKISPGEDIEQPITVTVEVGGVSALSSQCDNHVSVTIGFPEPCCPTLSVSCPTDIPYPGRPVYFTANISGNNPEIKPRYKWEVSAGKITGGQGTPVISVDTTDTQGQTVTATVEIEGLPPECDRTESCSYRFEIGTPTDPSRKVDEYGNVRRINEETLLTNFAIQLEQEPGAWGYVIAYGPRRVSQSLERARKFLVEKRAVEPNRLVLINGGHNKRAKVELWVRPTGAAAPEPNPNF